MAPLLPPNLLRYNATLNKANILKATPDDIELCARVMVDKSDVERFKELTYVLVREYKAIDGAYRQLVFGKDIMEREKDKRIGDLEKVIKEKDLHIGDLSRSILGLTSGRE